jgi:hypothetical protein
MKRRWVAGVAAAVFAFFALAAETTGEPSHAQPPLSASAAANPGQLWSKAARGPRRAVPARSSRWGPDAGGTEGRLGWGGASAKELTVPTIVSAAANKTSLRTLCVAWLPPSHRTGLQTIGANVQTGRHQPARCDSANVDGVETSAGSGSWRNATQWRFSAGAWNAFTAFHARFEAPSALSRASAAVEARTVKTPLASPVSSIARVQTTA